MNRFDRWLLSIDELTFAGIDRVNRWVQMYLHINRMIMIGVIGLIGVHGTVSFIVHASISLTSGEQVLLILLSFYFLVLFAVCSLMLLVGIVRDPPYEQIEHDEGKRANSGLLVLGASVTTPVILGVSWACIWWLTFPLIALVLYLFRCLDINPEDRVHLFGSHEARQPS